MAYNAGHQICTWPMNRDGSYLNGSHFRRFGFWLRSMEIVELIQDVFVIVEKNYGKKNSWKNVEIFRGL